MTCPAFATFLIASFVLAITPGPGVIYIITHTLRQGRSAGLASVCGIALGNLGNAAAASLGLAAILAASSAAFIVVKIAGAAYLIFLGIQALRGPPPAGTERSVTPSSTLKLFRDGFLVALLNPKTALFFAALLPQFIAAQSSALAQSLVLGGIFVSIALCTDSIYVLGASMLASTLRRQPRWRLFARILSAASFIGLGLYAAVASPRATAR
jgi:threonine/homoserine/homoserine lactone efflux protein